jgi:hypothetical protein
MVVGLRLVADNDGTSDKDGTALCVGSMVDGVSVVGEAVGAMGGDIGLAVVGSTDTGGKVGRRVGALVSRFVEGVDVLDGTGEAVLLVGAAVGARVSKRASHVSTSKKLEQLNSQSVRFSWKQPLPGSS